MKEHIFFGSVFDISYLIGHFVHLLRMQNTAERRLGNWGKQ